MRNFLQAVERITYAEHEERITSTPGEALPREKPRASTGLTRSQASAAKQRAYNATLREAKVALRRKRFGEAEALHRALPPSYQAKLRYWAVSHGVRWAP